MDDDTRTDYTPTPEGKQWLDSLGPMIATIALARDHIATDDELHIDMDLSILAEVKKWAKNRPHNIMRAL